MKNMKQLGSYAFLGGILVAILAALLPGFGMNMPEVPIVLTLLGLIVGLLNVSEKESMKFLLAAVAINVGSASLNPLAQVSTYVAGIVPIFQFIAVFVTPAAFVVALKEVYQLAKD